MKEYGAVRLFTAGEGADTYVSLARSELGMMKTIMRLGGLQQMKRTRNLPDGTVIEVASIFGQDYIKVVAPTLVPAKERLDGPKKGGIVVVGVSADNRSFYWAEKEDIIFLPTPADAVYGAFASHISHDGAVVAGSADFGPYQNPVVWHKPGKHTTVSVVDLRGATESKTGYGYTSAISGDGKYVGVVVPKPSIGSKLSYVVDTSNTAAGMKVSAQSFFDPNVGAAREITLLGGISLKGGKVFGSTQSWAPFAVDGTNPTPPSQQNCPPTPNDLALYPLWAHTDTELNASFHLYSAADDELKPEWVNYLEEVGGYYEPYIASGLVPQRPTSSMDFPNFGWWLPLPQSTYMGYWLTWYHDDGTEGGTFAAYTSNSVNLYANADPTVTITGVFGYVDHQAYKRITPVLTGSGFIATAGGASSTIITPTAPISGDVTIVAASDDGSVVCGHIKEGGTDYSRDPHTKPFGDRVNSFPNGAYTRAVKWSASTGVVDLGRGTAAGMSADGRVAVFNGDDGIAYLCSPEVGKLALLAPDRGIYSWVTGVSPDGKTIVGYASDVPCMWSNGGWERTKEGDIVATPAVDMTAQWGQYAWPTAVTSIKES